MQPGPPRRRRARPVADAPIDELLVRTEDLAKGWLLALLEQAPLDEAPDILAADLARDGPRVCEAVVRALANDVDLRRLQQGGTLELLVSQTGEFAGARSAESISCAVDALQAVIWSALHDALSHPHPDQISELAERLSVVTELVRGATLRRSQGTAPAAAKRETERASTTAPLRAAPAPASARGEHPAGGASGAGSGQPAAATTQDALWMAALQDEIVRAERAGAPLSLLIVELEEVDQVLAVEPPAEAAAIFSRFVHAVRSAMRRKDILASETDTRAWIVARDTGRAGANALGSRVAGAVRNAEMWRGAPLAVSVGVAVLGEDGHDHAALIDAAEESKFAAGATGAGIVGAVPEEGAGETPSEPGPGGPG